MQADVVVTGARPPSTPQAPTGGPMQPPLIIEKMTAQSVQEGQSACFECVVLGVPSKYNVK